MYNILDFYRAISEGNLKKVKNIYNELDGKVILNNNITYACGATWIIPLPLAIAFQKGYNDIAYFLIEKGANINAFCKKNNKKVKEFMPKDFKI